MVKRISVSISDWVYDQYLSIHNGNTSKFIEEMLVKGFESDIGETDNYKQKLLKLTKIVREQEVIISDKDSEISKLKIKLSGKEQLSPEEEREQKLKAIKFNTLKDNMHKL